MRWLYDYAWFAGFAVSAAVYVQLMRGPGSTLRGVD
jgi:cytosine/uracil/thiamine/allantoin permease